MATSGQRQGLRSAPVRVFMPTWIFGGKPAGLSDFCGWVMHCEADGSPIWQIQQVEAVHGDAPKLLTVSLLATARNAAHESSFSRVRRLADNDVHMTHDYWPQVVKNDEDTARRFPGDLAAIISSITLLTIAVPTAAQLPGVLQQITTTRLLPTFPNGSVHLIEASQSLGHRYGIARALIRADADVSEISGSNGLAFRAAHALFSDTNLGFSAYLEPLFTSLSPWVWGSPAGRAGGVIVYLFGRLVPGLRAIPGDVLALSLPRAGAIDTVKPAVETAAFQSTLRWWVARLDLLLSVATDPSNHVVDELYSPQRAIEKLLSLEQYFRDCQVIAANFRDAHTRRLVMFTALEILGGLNRKLSWNVVASASHARETLELLEAGMPSDVAGVLLPRARKAVEALEGLPNGFFDSSRIEADQIRVPDGKGADRLIPKAAAATQWLRVIRNSQHGFDTTPSKRERELLAMHNGEIDPALPDLAWLYLLRLMTFPELLRAPNVKPN